MLSDRPYMRDDYPKEKTSVLTWLISAIVAGFVIQLVVGSSWIGVVRSADRFLALSALSVPALENGWIWTLLTHAFLHSTGFIVHVIFNVFALYFLGRELLPMLGGKRFLGLFAAATVIGGAAWAAVHWRLGGNESHIGSTAAIMALFTVFACFYPNQRLNFLLFFVIPVTVRPKHIAYALVGMSLLGLLAYEIPQATLPFGLEIASSAQLGGILTGLLYYRFLHKSDWALGAGHGADIELPNWMKRGRKPAAAAPVYQVDLSPPGAKGKDDIRAEVDRILDKINSEGFGALTADEKRVLDDAKDLLSRR